MHRDRKRGTGKDGTDDTSRKSSQAPQAMEGRHDVPAIHLFQETCLRVGGDIHQIRHHSESHQTENEMKDDMAETDAQQCQGIKHFRYHEHLLATKLAHQDARESHHQKLSDGDGKEYRPQLSVAQVQQMFYIRDTACPTGKHYSRHKIIGGYRHSLARQFAQIHCHPFIEILNTLFINAAAKLRFF